MSSQPISDTQKVKKSNGNYLEYFTNNTFIFTLIGIGLLIPLLFFGEIKLSGNYDFEKLDRIGSFLAGTTGTIWALASVLLFYKSIIFGQKQQAENSYLDLISYLREHVASTKGEVNKKNYEGEEFFSEVFKKFRKSAQAADNCSNYNPETDYDRIFHRFEDVPDKILKLDYILCVYNDIYSKHQGQLGHFFRLVYNVIKIIDNNHVLNEKEKKTYVNLIQVALSNDILGLLFYNALTEQAKTGKGKDKFRGYLEKYQLLENIDPANIIQYKDLKQYPDTTFKHISETDFKPLDIDIPLPQ